MLTGFVVSVGMAAYYSFYRRNISIEITGKGVRFLRCGKEYRNFPSEQYTFTSYVVRPNINAIPAGTSKYLRTVNKADGKHKDYELKGFSKAIFEEIITCATFIEWHDIQPVSHTGSENNHHECHEYNINKALLSKKIKGDMKLFVIPIAFLIGALLVWFRDDVAVQDSGRVLFFLFFSLNWAAMISAAVIVTKLHRSAKLIPEKICLYSDKIVVDGKPFYFSRIRQIKATPPSYNKSNFELQMQKRKLIIAEGGRTITFIVGAISDTGAIPVFEDYEKFCNELRVIFANEPNKFAFDLV